MTAQDQLIHADGLYPNPVEYAGSQFRGIIVWGAKGLPKQDNIGHGDPYCIARIAEKGKAWNELPYGLGRRSETTMRTENPEWKMGFIADTAGLKEPTLYIGVYDADWFSEDDFIGRAQVDFATLLASKEPVDVDLKGSTAGSSSGRVRVSAGSVGILKEKKVPPSAYFPEMKPNGSIKSCMAKDINGDFPMRIGKAPLPQQLRGLFWLSDQGDGSALASFGGPSNDGGGCSTGDLLVAAGGGCRYKLRCGGDRTWAEADKGPAERSGEYDLIYHFIFDDAKNPTRCQIYPEWKAVPAVVGTAEFLGDFEMTLSPSDPETEYPGSVVWLRNSYFFQKEAVKGRYKLVQIIDEAGKRIEPAFSKFVDYQNLPKHNEPGKIYYREIATTQ